MTGPEPGIAQTLGDGIRRLLAPNPGPMTHWGTNTWIVGEGRVAVIDPGPRDAGHLANLKRALHGEVITHILVTHPHADHSPLAPILSEDTGATVLGFGPYDAGRSQVMQALEKAGGLGGGEGRDHAFAPDKTVDEGDVIAGENWSLEVLRTPGHFAGHLSFRLKDTLFSGDHVMDWASTLVSPPDGDLADFMATSERLAHLGLAVCHTGHGRSISNPADRLTDLVQHRRGREAAILAALTPKGVTIDQITARVYADTPAGLIPAARRNVLAHLIDLERRNLVKARPAIGLQSTYALV